MSKNKGKSLRRENVEATIKKRKETTAKALEVVEKLIEMNVTEGLLLQSVRHLNQSSYQDVIDERSILYLCGYPLCNKKLENIRKHQYKITRANGTLLLYDTTERKKFCSNICYKADKYLKDQLPSCPLWLIQPKDIKSITLLHDTKLKGSVGEMVNFDPSEFCSSFYSLNLTKNTNINNPENVEKECVNGSDNMTILKDSVDDDTDDDNIYCDVSSDNDDDFKNALDEDLNVSNNASKDLLLNNVSVASGSEFKNDSKILETQSVETDVLSVDSDGLGIHSFNSDNVNSNECTTVKSNITDNLNKSIVSSDNNDALVDCSLDNKEHNKEFQNVKPENNVKSSVKKAKSSKENKNKTRISTTNEENTMSPILALVLRIEQCIREWVSLDTMAFLLGDDKLKTLIEETCGVEKFKTRIESSVQVEKYLAICRKLNLLELQESKLDNSFIEDSDKKIIGPTQPVPDYKRLQEEAKEMEIKVRAFYRGDKQVQFDNVAESSKSNGEPASIPLVDQHAQIYHRRKILLDHLHKVFPDLLRALDLNMYNSSIILKVKQLVETFTLSAHNVMFRPAEWNFVGIVIIKLLSIQDEMLSQLISTEKSEKYFTLVLMSYEQDAGYLNRLITWLLYEHSIFMT